jgi:hypothetical protein
MKAGYLISAIGTLVGAVILVGYDHIESLDNRKATEIESHDVRITGLERSVDALETTVESGPIPQSNTGDLEGFGPVPTIGPQILPPDRSLMADALVGRTVDTILRELAKSHDLAAKLEAELARERADHRTDLKNLTADEHKRTEVLLVGKDETIKRLQQKLERSQRQLLLKTDANLRLTAQLESIQNAIDPEPLQVQWGDVPATIELKTRLDNDRRFKAATLYLYRDHLRLDSSKRKFVGDRDSVLWEHLQIVLSLPGAKGVHRFELRFETEEDKLMLKDWVHRDSRLKAKGAKGAKGDGSPSRDEESHGTHIITTA